MVSRFAHLNAKPDLDYGDFLEEILQAFADRSCAKLASQDLQAHLRRIHDSMIQGKPASDCAEEAFALIEPSEEFFVSQRIAKACRQDG